MRGTNRRRVGTGVARASRQIRFAFQPVYDLRTGDVVAVEALTRPLTGSVRDLLDSAHRRGRLVQVDLGLATRALRSVPGRHRARTLHLNITALTAASAPSALTTLLETLARVERRPDDVVLEIGPPFHGMAPEALLAGIRDLWSRGFRLALDGFHAGDVPLNVLSGSPVDMVKLDRTTLCRIGTDTTTTALTESLVHFADRTGRHLVATGVERTGHLDVLGSLGVRLAQGELLSADPSVARRGPATAAVPAHPAIPHRRARLSLVDFLRPARTLPAEATCEEVRSILVDQDPPGGIVGVDDQSRPQWSIDRTRFLLGVTGPFGHALHAHRPAAALADRPHVLADTADTARFFEVLARTRSERVGDEIVVVDRDGRCTGVVPANEIVRALAEMRVEEAASLNPLTRLPGSDVVARDVDRRLGDGTPFVAGWLDVDAFKDVNDTAGFAAADDLIRTLGHTLGRLATETPGTTVSHVGGDDFLIVCATDGITHVADRLLRTHWSAGALTVSVSLATLVCATPSVRDYREVSRLLAPLKRHAKEIAGPSWVNGRPGCRDPEVLYGRGPRPAPGRGDGSAVHR
ncbi:EAL domain-containing protein [Saccharomonospora iraqiensis]|uniref:EAL domain-containing protein n=1 Tax=Saccharomonospora iraqiensis TaxID=52698 RepID=UPI00022E0B4D